MERILSNIEIIYGDDEEQEEQEEQEDQEDHEEQEEQEELDQEEGEEQEEESLQKHYQYQDQYVPMGLPQPYIDKMAYVKENNQNNNDLNKSFEIEKEEENNEIPVENFKSKGRMNFLKNLAKKK